MSRRVLIARHADTDESKLEIVQGQTDTRLSEAGRLAALSLGDYLAHRHEVAQIVSSDLSRALETAELIASRLPRPVVVYTTPALREIACGVFEGRGFHALQQYRDSDPHGQKHAAPPGGETLAQLERRILNWFNQFLSCAIDGTLVVTHLGPISVILETVTGQDDESNYRDVIHPCHVIELAIGTDGKARVLALDRP